MSLEREHVPIKQPVCRNTTVLPLLLLLLIVLLLMLRLAKLLPHAHRFVRSHFIKATTKPAVVLTLITAAVVIVNGFPFCVA
jgi:ABC-type sulfate transport system permease component